MFKLKLIILCIVISICLCRTYPLYKQCDPQWKDSPLGFSKTKTICSDGSLLTSVAMGLKGAGNSISNPPTLDIWLRQHNGWTDVDHYVWHSIDNIGMSFVAFVTKDQVKAKIDNGFILILSVRNKTHWVLAKSRSGDTIYVNDPLYPKDSYSYSQIDVDHHAVYKVPAHIQHNLIKEQ